MTAEARLDRECKTRGFVLTCVGHANGNVRLDANHQVVVGWREAQGCWMIWFNV
jgi:hypothetical protein